MASTLVHELGTQLNQSRTCPCNPKIVLNRDRRLGRTSAGRMGKEMKVGVWGWDQGRWTSTGLNRFARKDTSFLLAMHPQKLDMSIKLS